MAPDARMQGGLVGRLIGDARGIFDAAGGAEAGSPVRFPLIEGTRALAALSVFAFHAGILVKAPEGVATDFVNTLAIGVPIFFVLSGFLLYRPFAVAHLRGTPGPVTIPYAWRRVLRIVPAFWVALTLALLLGNGPDDGSRIPALYLFGQVYHPDTLNAGIGQAWSLDCEIVYYAMLPVVAIAVRALARGAGYGRRLSVEAAGVAVLIAISVAYQAWFYTFGNVAGGATNIFFFHPGFQLHLFALGMAVALWSAHREVAGGEDRLVAVIRRHPNAVWLAAAAAFAVSVALVDELTPRGVSLSTAARDLCALLVFLPAAWSVTHGVPRRVLGNRWIAGLGVVSYSFYLYHQALLTQLFDRVPDRFETVPGDVALIAIALAGGVAAAVGSYLLVERPALAQRHRFDRVRRPAAPRPAVTAAAVVALVAVVAAPVAAARQSVEGQRPDAIFARSFELLARFEPPARLPTVPEGERTLHLSAPGGLRQEVRCRRRVGRGDWACISLAPDGTTPAAVWTGSEPAVSPDDVLIADDNPDTLPNN